MKRMIITANVPQGIIDKITLEIINMMDSRGAKVTDIKVSDPNKGSGTTLRDLA